MRFKILPILFLATFFSLSCSKDTETKTTTKYIGCSKNMEGQGECLRWMDRKIYFAFSNASQTDRNNEFQKGKVKEALNEIQELTSLGAGYFQYQEVDESLLNPIVEPGLSVNEYKSFILIWPDAVFNDFVVNNLGGNVPDPNAITVINSAYKRKFYIILRASCFVSAAACNAITETGLRALIARQMGFLLGLRPADCGTSPEGVMCASLPVDAQWSELNKQQWASSLDNNLETILNNPNFYDEYVPNN